MDEYFRRAVAATLEGIAAGVSGPFGATIVRNGAVLVAVANRQLGDRDPSQHAEMVAVREACRLLGTMDLSDCTVYATCEPCPMCVGVLVWAGVREVYFSATKEDAEARGFGDMHLRRFLRGEDDSVIHLVPVAPREDCVALFDAFRARHGGP